MALAGTRFNLHIPDGWKAELTQVTWQCPSLKPNPRQLWSKDIIITTCITTTLQMSLCVPNCSEQLTKLNVNNDSFNGHDVSCMSLYLTDSYTYMTTGAAHFFINYRHEEIVVRQIFSQHITSKHSYSHTVIDTVLMLRRRICGLTSHTTKSTS